MLFSIYGFMQLVLVRKRAVKTLKPSFFVSGDVGTFVGFLRHKRVIDGFARCRLCQVDLSFAGRGMHNLWDHWKGREHTRLEQKFRILTNRPLLDKSCRPVPREEDHPIRIERMSDRPVFRESPLGLTVDERIAVEVSDAKLGEKPDVNGNRAAYSWLCNFIKAYVSMTSFQAVIRFLDEWTNAMQPELRFTERLVTYEECQVCMSFVV